jgi:hypothetical protein
MHACFLMFSDTFFMVSETLKPLILINPPMVLRFFRDATDRLRGPFWYSKSHQNRFKMVPECPKGGSQGDLKKYPFFL